ncbi:hypothetical protein LTR62_003454 [Meristemomyces frigidus]|uniref:Xylanolytic transcriptional activator regulatory domain-containing protein n=1 Tax=Meristemomyces frigidus TaxID=1508187 RepID=A0AAN7TIM3_9PEZI|nr:hypothetical protein LTR62_003454 [Meristemomyces frigidus]
MPDRLATPSSLSKSGRTDQDGRRSLDAVSLRVPACVTFEEESDEQPTGNVAANQEVTDQTSAAAYSEHLSPDSLLDSFAYQSPMSEAALPSFISPLPNCISHDDLAFLAKKGAMKIPEPDLRDEILRSYLFSVHPFMPMLEFRPLLRAILNVHENRHISLLLLQAVMFAGLHSLPPNVIHRLGYQTTKQARQVFFNRVKYLYDFEVESDDAAVFQSLVLMSSWYGKWDERRHTWHFTGLAYDLARTMGLHREPKGKHMSEKDQRFRRRLWWSLYIRDRLLALGTRRPVRIRDDEFDVAMLTLDDFDLEPLEELHSGQKFLPRVDESTTTALMCIELAKLCVSIGNIVSSRYTTLSDQPDVPHTVMMVSRRYNGHDNGLQKREAELSAWFGQLKTNIQGSSFSDFLDNPGSCSQVHWSMLNLTYYTAINVLHRAQALQPPSDEPEARSVHKSSKSKVKDAARNITKLSMSMLRNDQVRYLGVMGVTALVAACLSHMLDVSSADEDVRDASTFRLQQSLQVLDALRGIWRSADAADTFIASVARKAGVGVLLRAAADRADPANNAADGVARASAGSQNRLASQGSAGASMVDWPLMSDQGRALLTSTQIKPFSMPTQSAGYQRQSQALSDAQSRDIRHGIRTPDAISTATLSSSDCVLGSVDRTETGLLGDNITPSNNTMFSGLPNDITFFDRNNEMSTSMAVEPMSFNFDFYSNTLGLTNDHGQGFDSR